MKSTTTLIALLGLLGSVACSGPVEITGGNVFATGRVISVPAGAPIDGATIRLMGPPGIGPQRTYGTATSGPDGRYEIDVQVDEILCDGGSWDIHIRATHATYTQEALITMPCSAQTVDIPMRSHLVDVRIEPAAADVDAGSASQFTAQAVLADGTELTQPDTEVWELFWHVANDVTPSGVDCGSVMEMEANPVQYQAPDAVPSGGCSAAGGATVLLSVQAYGVAGGEADAHAQVTIANP